MNEPTNIAENESPGAQPGAPSPWGSKELTEAVTKLNAQYDHFKEKLKTRKAQIRLWNQRFLHDERAFDKRTEKERATRPFMLDPHVYTNIMAMVTHLVDQFMASSPQLKVRGRGWEDKGDEALERLQQYDLTERNPAPLWVGSTFRRAAIGGIAINRMRYVEQYDTITPQPDETEQQEYAAAVDEASKTAGLPPSEPGQYAEWEAQVRSSTGKPLPPTPIGATERIAVDVGTKIDEVSLDDIEWDPAIPTIEDQPCIWLRSFPRRDTLLALAEQYPNVWDAEAIKRVPRETTSQGKCGADIKKDTLAALGVSDHGNDPYYDDIIELKQRWAPREKTLRYVALANGITPLTVDPNYYPLNVSRHPFFGFFNVPTDGVSIGISEYQPNGLLNDWNDQLQSMQLYHMALRIFTPMAVAKGSDLKAILEENCVPGGIIELDDFDDVRPLFEKFTNEAELAERFLAMNQAKLDRATGVNEVTRGEQATLNRVTGAEFLGRQGAMQVRMKDRLYRFGVTMGAMARFNCALRYQFSNRADLANIAGLDPFAAYNRRTLWTGIQSDYIFTPAATAADANLQVQQLTELAKFLGQLSALVPGGQGMMQLTSRILQALRIPGADELAKALRGDVDLQQQMQQLQQQLAEASEKVAATSKENDLLRRKLPQPLPPAAELAAELEASKAAAPEAAPQPEGEGPAETAAEGGVEEPGEAEAPPPEEVPL